MFAACDESVDAAAERVEFRSGDDISVPIIVVPQGEDGVYVAELVSGGCGYGQAFLIQQPDGTYENLNGAQGQGSRDYAGLIEQVYDGFPIYLRDYAGGGEH